MGCSIVILICVALVVLGLGNWPLALLIIVVGSMIVWGVSDAIKTNEAEKIKAWIKAKEAERLAKEKAEQDRVEAKEAERLAKEKAEQDRVSSRNAVERARTVARLERLVWDSQASASRLPLFVSEAELALDRAEREFSEGLYSPFWEAMEDAAQNLAHYDSTLQSLDAARKQHERDAPPLKPDAISFSLGVSMLPDTTETTCRMKALYRKAQKDPHFAQVYEQRRTNSILIEGFRSLGEALTSFGTRLESQLKSLGTQLDFQLTDIQTALAETADQLGKQHNALIESAREWHEEARSASADLAAVARDSAQQAEEDAQVRRAYEAETRKMLDNIQRRRLPANRRIGDGAY